MLDDRSRPVPRGAGSRAWRHSGPSLGWCGTPSPSTAWGRCLQRRQEQAGRGQRVVRPAGGLPAL